MTAVRLGAGSIGCWLAQAALIGALDASDRATVLLATGGSGDLLGIAGVAGAVVLRVVALGLGGAALGASLPAAIGGPQRTTGTDR